LNPDKLKLAIREYEHDLDPEMKSTYHLVVRDDTLVVHIRSGDLGGNIKDFKRFILQTAMGFTRVYIISGLHTDERYRKLEDSLRILRIDIGQILLSLKSLGIEAKVHSSFSADHDLYMMFLSKNLLVHKGGFSALGGLVCEGRVFWTASVRQTTSEDYLGLMSNPQPRRSSSETSPFSAWFDSMGKLAPSCCAFLNIGSEDLRVCWSARELLLKDCWVAVTIRNNDWRSVQRIVDRSTCWVAVFDCIGDGVVPERIAWKVRHVKKCLGVNVSWGNAMRILNASQAPSLLQFDIEGSEWGFLTDLVQNYPQQNLPFQISFELHLRTHLDLGSPWVHETAPSELWHINSPLIVSDFFKQLTAFGDYRVVARKENVNCPHCVILTIMRGNTIL
jgi:hypothetical protein